MGQKQNRIKLLRGAKAGALPAFMSSGYRKNETALKVQLLDPGVAIETRGLMGPEREKGELNSLMKEAIKSC